MFSEKNIRRFTVQEGEKVKWANFPTAWVGDGEKSKGKVRDLKERADEALAKSRAELAEAQELLYADDTKSVLVIFQAMDAAGKDGTIKHVMSGVNPQGCQVFSFKKPSAEELDHTFLWRCMKALPERGRIGIFNRSYYEDVLVVKVHPEYLAPHFPTDPGKNFWEKRYEDINAFEKHLHRNGTTVIKFFLNVSKEEQRKRFIARLDDPAKNWKFSAADLAERAHWEDYQQAYADALTATSTKHAPWHVIPADDKHVMRALVADIIVNRIQALDPRMPEVSAETRAEYEALRGQLMSGA